MSDPVLELLAAPPSPSLSVDEHAVYAGGRRRLRRRTLRRTGIGVVSIAGVAAIAFGTLGSGVKNDTLPAGPSPSASSAARVSAELLDGRYAVEVVPVAGKDQPNVIFYSIANGKRTELSGSSANPNVISLGSGIDADGVMLGIAPASATKFTTATGSAKGGMSMDQQPLPGTEYQAIALDFENAADVHEYLDTTWMNSAGEVHAANGKLLQTVTIAGNQTFFVNVYSSRIGVFTSDGSIQVPLKRGPSTTMGYGKKDVGGTWLWRSVSLLPVGSRDVKFTWSDADYTSEVFMHTLSDTKEVVALSDATGNLAKAPKVTVVAWTDAAGTRHTEAVK